MRKPTKPTNIVLVIDDESQIRRFVSAGLELYGYSVREAENGAAGVRIAADIQPDVIVIDLGLPDMSGVEVLETIRSWSNVPIIVLSIQSNEEQKVHLLKRGADDYVTARRTAAHWIGLGSMKFAEGRALSSTLAELIPQGHVGRMLSLREAADLLQRVERKAGSVR